jgi:hypothetical protein
MAFMPPSLLLRLGFFIEEYSMIKGLAITPPVIGRISIGKVVEKNGKRLPEKDDQFTITSQVQNRDGWVNHPLDEALRKSSGSDKLRSIPIRFLFNEPDLNLRAEYSMFDRQSGRPLCVGNGETCKRYTATGIQTLPCPSPDGCDLAKGGACKPYGRLNVMIGDAEEMGTFIFRTTGFNSIRTLAARLSYYQAASGNLLACLPLELRLRGKSTTLSHRAPIYYADITAREGLTMEEAFAQARQLNERRQSGSYDQLALDVAARAGFGNGAFEDSEEETSEIIEEFFTETDTGTGNNSTKPSTEQQVGLREKLNAKVANVDLTTQ